MQGVEENNYKIARTFKLSERESTSANGWYDPSTGEIWIDVNAGVNGEGLILNTASHELTHFIKDWSPEKYKVFADFLMESYAEKGVSVESLIEKQIEKAKKNGRSISREEAFDEVVADSCESFLQDSNAAVKIASLEAKDKTLAQKIRTFIGQLLANVRKLLSGTSPDSAEGKLVREMHGSLEKLHELWTDALADASKSYRSAGAEINDRAEKSTSKLSDRFDNSSLESAYNDYDKPISADDIIVLRSIGRKSINEFTSKEIEKAQKWAYKFYKELGVKSPFFRAWFGEWRAHDKTPIEYTTVDTVDIDANLIRAERGTFINVDTKWSIVSGSLGEGETKRYSRGDKTSVKMLSSLRKILESAVLIDTVASVRDSAKKHINTAFMHKLFTPVIYNGEKYVAKINVEEYFDQGSEKRRIYHLEGIKIEPIAKRFAEKSASLNRADIDSINSISDLFAFVKEFDKNFSPKPVDEHLINKETGEPKVFYHGTNGDFTSFSYGEIGNATGVGILGDGFYFTDKKTLAKNYGKNVMPCYLKLSNPYIATASDAYKLNTGKLSAQGYDGVILKAPKGNVYMVFDNTQIKSATDNIGTFDGENADIRYSDRDPDAVSNRDVLANALKGAAKTEGERKWLAEYQRQIGAMDKENDKLDMLRTERAKLRKESESRNRARIEDLSRMITKSEEKINRYDRQLLEIEAGKHLREQKSTCSTRS